MQKKEWAKFRVGCGSSTSWNRNPHPQLWNLGSGAGGSKSSLNQHHRVGLPIEFWVCGLNCHLCDLGFPWCVENSILCLDQIDVGYPTGSVRCMAQTYRLWPRHGHTTVGFFLSRIKWDQKQPMALHSLHPLDRDRNYVEGLIQLNCSQNLFPPFLNMQIKIKNEIKRKEKWKDGRKQII